MPFVISDAAPDELGEQQPQQPTLQPNGSATGRFKVTTASPDELGTDQPPSSSTDKSPSFFDRIGGWRGIAGTGIRGLAGVLGAEGMWPGAAINAVGEGAAELAEGSDFSPTRIAAEGVLGAVPFGKIIKGGKIVESALRNAAVGGIGTGVRELAAGQQIDPSAVLTNAAIGGATGGALAKFLGRTKVPTPSTTVPYELETTSRTGPGTRTISGGKINTGRGGKVTMEGGVSVPTENEVKATYNLPPMAPEPEVAVTNPTNTGVPVIGTSATASGRVQKGIAKQGGAQSKFQSDLTSSLSKLLGREPGAVDALGDLDSGIEEATKQGKVARTQNTRTVTQSQRAENTADLQYNNATAKAEVQAEKDRIASERVAAAKTEGMVPVTGNPRESYSAPIPGGRESVGVTYKVPKVEDPSEFTLEDNEAAAVNRIRNEAGVPPTTPTTPTTPRTTISPDWAPSGLGPEVPSFPLKAELKPGLEVGDIPLTPTSEVDQQTPLGKVLIPGQQARQDSYSALLAKLKGEAVPTTSAIPAEASVNLLPETTPPVPSRTLSQGEEEGITSLGELQNAIHGEEAVTKGNGTFKPEPPLPTPSEPAPFYKSPVDVVGQAYRGAKGDKTANPLAVRQLGVGLNAEASRAGLPTKGSTDLASFLGTKISPEISAEEKAASQIIDNPPTPTPPPANGEVPPDFQTSGDWVNEQQSLIDRMKGEKGAVDPRLLKLFAPITGAAIGAPLGSTMEPDDPGYGAIKGAVGGGLAGYAVASGMESPINGSAAQGAIKELINWRNSGLLSGLAQVKKPLSDMGAYAGLIGEKALSGDTNTAINLGREAFRLPTNLREFLAGFKNPEVARQALGETNLAKEENPVGALGQVIRPFAAAQNMTSKAMQRAGIPAEEATDSMMLGDPKTAIGKWWLAGQNLPGFSGQAVRAIRPFARIGTNIFERGLERTPLIGMGFEGPMKEKLAKQAMGLGAMGVGAATSGFDQNAAENGDPTSSAVKGLRRASMASYGLPFALGETLAGANALDLYNLIPGLRSNVEPPSPKDSVLDWVRKLSAAGLDQFIPAILDQAQK